MKFTDEQLSSFIALYKQEFGEQLDTQEAQRQATALVSLVKRAYKPMTEKDYMKYKQIAKSDNCDTILMTPNKTN